MNRVVERPQLQEVDKENYRHFNHAGVPFRGPELPLMYNHEYDQAVQRMGSTAYGIFDISKPEQQHFGRTLKQVMDRAYANQYELIVMTEYNNGVVSEADKPPGLFVYVMWIEKYDTTTQNAKQIAEKNS